MKGCVAFLLLALPLFSYASDGDDLYKRGLDFYQDHKFLLATGSFRKALDEGRKDALVYLYLGNCYVQQGDFDRALDSFSQGLLAGGENDLQATLYHNIGYAYYARKDWSNSIDYFRKAYSLLPTLLQARWYSGMACYQLRDRDGTIVEWEAYLSAETNGPQSDNIRKALAVLKATNFAFPNPEATNAVAAASSSNTNRKSVPDSLINIEGLLDQTRPSDKGKVSDDTSEGIEK
jgi:tetratricopeptide (TPR) repeat protein